MTPSPNSTSTISRCGASLLGGRDKPGAGAMRSRLASLAPVRPASTGSNASITMASMWEELPARQRPALLAAGAELAVEATTAEVVGALRKGSVRSILLKGVSFGRWLYDESTSRSSNDVDLLVSPADRRAAESLLVGLGFHPFPSNAAGEEVRHSFAWDHELRPVGVDLHLTLSGV